MPPLSENPGTYPVPQHDPRAQDDGSIDSNMVIPQKFISRYDIDGQI